MAAPSITSFVRNGLPTNTDVIYTLKYSVGAPSVSGVTPSASTYNQIYYGPVTVTVTCNDNTTSSLTSCTHNARGKSDKQQVSCTLTWINYKGDRTLHSGSWPTDWTFWYNSDAEEKPSYTDSETIKYLVTGVSKNWNVYYKEKSSDYYTYHWTESNGSYAKGFAFYAPPESFTFTNCIAGKTWLVSEGINKNLITNLTSFQAVAKRWKQWKNQEEQSACLSFDSPISAERLNTIYTYMEMTGNFKTGDKVSAKMFNDLADKINTR